MPLAACLICLGYSLCVSAGFASDWETIQKRGRLIVGVKDNLPPLGMKNATGNLEGFEIDIAKELAKELLGSDAAITFVPVKNIDRLPALFEDRVDLVVAQLTLTNNRARLVDFSPPYYSDGTVLLVKRGVNKQQFDSGQKDRNSIAVLKGSASIVNLQYRLPKATLVGVDSYQEGFTALETGKVQAFAGDASATAEWLKQHQTFDRLGGIFPTHSLSIAMPRGLQYDKLRQQVTAVVTKWRLNGWLRSRADYWGLP